MSYTRVNWKDYPDTTTPLSAAKLNQMDEGIESVDDAIGSDDISSVGTSVTAAILALNTEIADASSSATVKYVDGVLYVKNSSGTWEELSLSPIKSIQRGTYTLSANTSTATTTTVSINSVNTNKCAVIVNMSESNIATGTSGAINGGATWTDLSSTSLTLKYCGRSNSTISWQVIEYV